MIIAVRRNIRWSLEIYPSIWYFKTIFYLSCAAKEEETLLFITLLAVTFLIALLVSFIVARMFAGPVDNILKRIISDEISGAWLKYLKFAIFVVGISNGVRIWELEKYITPPQYTKDTKIIALTTERWILEVYRTVIETLQGIAWMLLVFFIFALIAYVIVRISESRKPKQTQ